MTYLIILSNQKYAALALATSRSGTKSVQHLHDTIHRLQTSNQRKRPSKVRELAQKQYQERKFSHIPIQTILNARRRETHDVEHYVLPKEACG